MSTTFAAGNKTASSSQGRSDRVRLVSHKGSRILHIDFSNATPAEFLLVMEQAKKTIGDHPKGTLLTLTDVTNAHYNREVTDALKEYVAHNKPYVRAGAVVGLNELKKIVFNLLNRLSGRNLKGMDSLDAARDWLASQE